MMESNDFLPENLLNEQGKVIGLPNYIYHPQNTSFIQ